MKYHVEKPFSGDASVAMEWMARTLALNRFAIQSRTDTRLVAYRYRPMWSPHQLGTVPNTPAISITCIEVEISDGRLRATAMFSGAYIMVLLFVVFALVVACAIVVHVSESNNRHATPLWRECVLGGIMACLFVVMFGFCLSGIRTCGQVFDQFVWATLAKSGCFNEENKRS